MYPYTSAAHVKDLHDRALAAIEQWDAEDHEPGQAAPRLKEIAAELAGPRHAEKVNSLAVYYAIASTRRDTDANIAEGFYLAQATGDGRYANPATVAHIEIGKTQGYYPELQALIEALGDPRQAGLR